MIEGRYRISVLAHFIACENGWRGNAYLYRDQATTAEEVLFVPDLCLNQDEALALAMQRGRDRAGEKSRGR